jgi:hypothetical protein
MTHSKDIVNTSYLAVTQVLNIVEKCPTVSKNVWDISITYIIQWNAICINKSKASLLALDMK